MKNWVPKFIQKNLAYKPQEVVTAADYNALFNLLITQGDYNSEWLAWLTNEGFAEFFKDLNGEDIKQMVVQAASEQLASLASASANKTSAHLNNPTFTFFDESATKSTLELLKPILDEYGIVGTASCYSSLVGAGNPYMDVIDLQALQAYGYAVVNHGTTKENLTADTVEAVISESAAFMSRNGLVTSDNVFAYNNIEEPENDTVFTVVSKRYTHGIGNTVGVNDTDSYNPAWLCVIPLTADEQVIRDAIEMTLQHNCWCVFKVDSSVADFAENIVPVLKGVIETILMDSNARIVTAPVAASWSANTINNTIKRLQKGYDTLSAEVTELRNIVNSFRKITHGHVNAGVPAAGNEGDIHIMYE